MGDSRAAAPAPSLAAAARSMAGSRGGRKGSAWRPPSHSAQGLRGDGSTSGTLHIPAPPRPAPHRQPGMLRAAAGRAPTARRALERREVAEWQIVWASCNAKYFLIPRSFAVTPWKSQNKVLGSHKTGPSPAGSLSVRGPWRSVDPGRERSGQRESLTITFYHRIALCFMESSSTQASARGMRARNYIKKKSVFCRDYFPFFPPLPTMSVLSGVPNAHTKPSAETSLSYFTSYPGCKQQERPNIPVNTN